VPAEAFHEGEVAAANFIYTYNLKEREKKEKEKEKKIV